MFINIITYELSDIISNTLKENNINITQGRRHNIKTKLLPVLWEF